MFHPSRGRAGRDDAPGARRGRARSSPTRVVFDSLSEMRLLAQSSLRYRRQILALKQFFVGRECTVAAARRPDVRRSPTCSCRASPTASMLAGAARARSTAPSARRLRVVKSAAASSAAATTTS